MSAACHAERSDGGGTGEPLHAENRSPKADRLPAHSSWRIVWVHEKCHKQECEERRAFLTDAAAEVGASLTCLKKSKTFDLWCARSQRAPFVLLTDGREIRPVIQVMAQPGFTNIPVTTVVLADLPKHADRIETWAKSLPPSPSVRTLRVIKDLPSICHLLREASELIFRGQAAAPRTELCLSALCGSPPSGAADSGQQPSPAHRARTACGSSAASRSGAPAADTAGAATRGGFFSSDAPSRQQECPLLPAVVVSQCASAGGHGSPEGSTICQEASPFAFTPTTAASSGSPVCGSPVCGYPHSPVYHGGGIVATMGPGQGVAHVPMMAQAIAPGGCPTQMFPVAVPCVYNDAGVVWCAGMGQNITWAVGPPEQR